MRLHTTLIAALCAAGTFGAPFPAIEKKLKVGDSTNSGKPFLTCAGEWSSVAGSSNARKIELHSSAKSSEIYYCNEKREAETNPTVGLLKGVLDKLLSKVTKLLGELNKRKKDRDAAKKDYEGKRKKYESVKGKGNQQEENKCKKEMDQAKGKYDRKQEEVDEKQNEYDSAKEEYDEAK